MKPGAHNPYFNEDFQLWLVLNTSAGISKPKNIRVFMEEQRQIRKLSSKQNETKN